MIAALALAATAVPPISPDGKADGYRLHALFSTGAGPDEQRGWAIVADEIAG